MIRKLLRLAPADRRLLVRATALLAAIRVGLRVLPLRTLLRLVERSARPAPPDRVAWAVDAAGNRLGATCLARALAARAMLPDARLRIGVRAGPSLEAHAWVERDGRIVVGGVEAASYLPLQATTLPASRCTLRLGHRLPPLRELGVWSWEF